MTSSRRYPCLRCAAEVTKPGACCNTCRAVDPDYCARLAREWKVAYWRREARRLRILHRGTVPWAATGPMDDRRAPQPVEVRRIDTRYLPRRTA